MSSSARRYVAGSWRTLCSAFTLDPTAEKFAFARFNNDDGDEFPPNAADADGQHQQRRRRTVRIGGSDTELADFPKTSIGVDGAGGGHPVKVGTTGDSVKDGNDGAGHWMAMEGGLEGGGDSASNNQNRISAWQAGWNVTNAIQVYSARI